jgi:DNA-binding NarL/FixJ family response regulator
MLKGKITEILVSVFQGMLEVKSSKGSRCMKRLAAIQPDIVIMDIRLKSENGLDLIKRIKEDRPDCFLIVHSMYDSVEYYRRILNLGANAFLSKNRNSITDMISVITGVLENIMHEPVRQNV